MHRGTLAPAAVEWGRQRVRALRVMVETGVAPDRPAYENHTADAKNPDARVNPILRRLPNVLTVSRILLAPVVAVLLIRANGYGDLSAGVLFAIGALTDQLDGVLARAWRAESAFGTVVDPLADKLLIGTAILCLTLRHRLPWLALELPAVRHVVYWVARFLSPRSGMILPSWTGKVGAWLLYLGVGLIIISDRDSPLALLLFWTGMIATYVDLIRYGYQAPAVQALRAFPDQVINLAHRIRTGHD